MATPQADAPAPAPAKSAPAKPTPAKGLELSDAQKDQIDAINEQVKVEHEATLKAIDKEHEDAVAEADRVRDEKTAGAEAAFDAHQAAEKNVGSASLAPASESSDPEVQQLLAVRQAAQSNHDRDGEVLATRSLARLGFK